MSHPVFSTPDMSRQGSVSSFGAASSDGLLPSREFDVSTDSSSGYYANPDHPGFGPGVALGGGSPSLRGSPGGRFGSPGGPKWGAHSPPASLLSNGASSRASPFKGAFPPSFTSIRHRGTPSLSTGMHATFLIDPSDLTVTHGSASKAEADDYLHDPKGVDEDRGAVFSSRAFCNLGMLALLAVGVMALFAGYPIASYVMERHAEKMGGFNLGKTNATGQTFFQAGLRTDLIDPDTPEAARTRKSFNGGEDMVLVFSDEFNTDGRSFYPGDDPFWEAVDLHYWGTNNYEWYDPAAVTTSGGSLRITLSETPEHNLNFRGGMIQSWNKVCITGGLLIASVQLPGSADVGGLWPAFWAMGNLGRAGYGASLEGTWPYSYDACDVGTLQNQTTVDGKPTASQTGGDTVFNRKHGTNALSFLTGQRLSACTCPGDDHPGPTMPDGSLKGRAAPEIDVFEAQVNGEGRMTVSQSGQWAPFNYKYEVTNTTGPAYEFFQRTGLYNSYTGEVTQQSTSGVTETPQGAVQRGGDNTFAEYGFEYQPGHGGYIEWISGGRPSWRLNPSGMEADPISKISARPFPEEPMYMIFNLGMSSNFGTVHFDELVFPAVMSVDWVRVYQPKDKVNVGCSPDEFPTADYIQRHLPAYTNANLTLWGNTPEEGGYGQVWPRNRLNPGACDAPFSKLPGSPTNPKPKAPAMKHNEIAVGQ